MGSQVRSGAFQFFFLASVNILRTIKNETFKCIPCIICSNNWQVRYSILLIQLYAIYVSDNWGVLIDFIIISYRYYLNTMSRNVATLQLSGLLKCNQSFVLTTWQWTDGRYDPVPEAVSTLMTCLLLAQKLPHPSDPQPVYHYVESGVSRIVIRNCV
jgi:hypothetical protein